MAKESYFYFLKPPGLPASQVHHLLGRIVKDPTAPAADFVPNGRPCDMVAFPAPPLTSRLASVSALLSSASETTRSAALTSLAFLANDRGATAELAFECAQLEVTYLQQHADTFRALRRATGIAPALARLLRVGGRAYFVTGVMTCRGGRFRTASTTQHGVHTGSEVPLAAVGLAAVGVPAVPGLLDVVGGAVGPAAVAVGTRREVRSVMAGETVPTGEGGLGDDEHVVALQYRLVRRNFLGVGPVPTLRSGQVRHDGGSCYGDEDEESEVGDQDDEDEDPLSNVELTDDFVDGSVIVEV